MKEKRTLIKKETAKISMPKSIVIGDPMYFEDKVGLQYTYERNFRGKSSWKGELHLIEDDVVYPPDKYIDKELKIKDVYMKAYFGYNEDILRLVLDGMWYKGQKRKNIDIGVDTASYIFEINGVGDIIKTGADGCWGCVSEYYLENKVVAIVIEMGLPDYTGKDFEDHKKYLNTLFNCELK